MKEKNLWKKWTESKWKGQIRKRDIFHEIREDGEKITRGRWTSGRCEREEAKTNREVFFKEGEKFTKGDKFLSMGRSVKHKVYLNQRQNLVCKRK